MRSEAVESKGYTPLDTEEVVGSNPIVQPGDMGGPTRRHGLQNVPVTWVTLLDRTDFERLTHSVLHNPLR